MILPVLPSSSCCAASSCLEWHKPLSGHCYAMPCRAVVGDLIEQGAPGFDAANPILSQLLKAEMAEREVRSIAYHMKAARFPAYKDLSGFTFVASEINEALVRQ